MIIQPSNRHSVGLVQDVPQAMLVDKVLGQRIDARVMQATLATEMVMIKVGDSLVQLQTPVDLKAGQKIQLEWVEQAGKTVLKLVLPADVAPKTSPALQLQLGQQLAVEVVKLLAEGRVLAQASIPSNSLTAKPIIQQFDIDIAQLSKSFKLGDKLAMDIVSVKPLQIQLQAETGAQKIGARLQQLISQHQANPKLTSLVNLVQNKTLPQAMQQAITQVIESSLDKAALTQPNALKQAMSLSGSFTEHKLLNQPTSSTQDFKANVVKVMAAIETVMSQVRGGVAEGDNINKLPSQVLSALASQGKTVEQLLHVLLSGKTSASPAAVQSLLPGLLTKEQAVLLTQMLSSSNSATIPNSVAGRQAPLELAEMMKIFKDVESVYNKVQLNQLLMLREAESSTSTVASWLFDIPIKDKDTLDILQMQIDQHKEGEEKEEEVWNVQLRLDTQNLGPVQATVMLDNKDVKVVFRAERSESAVLLEEHIDELYDSLSDLGITPSHMSCVCGEVSEANITPSKIRQIESVSLVNISV